jgi:hypothetical protein
VREASYLKLESLGRKELESEMGTASEKFARLACRLPDQAPRELRSPRHGRQGRPGNLPMFGARGLCSAVRQRERLWLFGTPGLRPNLLHLGDTGWRPRRTGTGNELASIVSPKSMMPLIARISAAN